MNCYITVTIWIEIMGLEFDTDTESWRNIDMLFLINCWIKD